jgi:negative regulator of replication initiation
MSDQNLDITRELPGRLRSYFAEKKELVYSSGRTKKGI